MDSENIPCVADQMSPDRMNLAGFVEELLVVIVLFNTKPDESPAYASLLAIPGIVRPFPEMLMYDNSPLPVDIKSPGITYFHDPQNSGVSKAYNNACVCARQKKKKWMLFLDQDTSVYPEFFQRLQGAVVSWPKSVAFVPRMTDSKGLISPFHFASGRGIRIKAPATILDLATYRFINSGLLIRVSAFVAAGGYDENIPLDFSDISFGDRLKKVTDHIRVLNVPLHHQFSDNEKIPVEAALARFHLFRMGAFAMGNTTGRSSLYFIRALMRGCRLCLRYNDVRFLIQFLQRPVHG